MLCIHVVSIIQDVFFSTGVFRSDNNPNLLGIKNRSTYNTFIDIKFLNGVFAKIIIST